MVFADFFLLKNDNQATLSSAVMCVLAFLTHVTAVSGALLWSFHRQIQKLCGAAPRLC